MVRHYQAIAPIRVQADAHGRPTLFTWQGRTRRIASIEDVREPRLDWWASTGEIHRIYYLVTTPCGLICEIYHDVIQERWYLGRVFD